MGDRSKATSVGNLSRFGMGFQIAVGIVLVILGWLTHRPVFVDHSEQINAQAMPPRLLVHTAMPTNTPSFDIVTTACRE